MKTIIVFLFIISLYFPMNCKGDNNDKLVYWDNILSNNLSSEFDKMRVIRKSDINDEDNLEAFKKYNPDIIIYDDFNKNGKTEYIIPCKKEGEKNKWYIFIFEKENETKYDLLNYFSFQLQSIYIVKEKGKNFNYIRLGESYASDYMINIFWNGKRFVIDR